MIVDTHIHLSHYLYNQEFPFLSFESDQYLLSYGARDQLIAQFQASGIKACIDPAIDLVSNQRLLALAEQYPGFLFSAVGVHPKRTFVYQTMREGGTKVKNKLRWSQRKQLEQFADHPSVVAVGETGLDYHLARKEQHRLRQKTWFIWQIKLAHRKNLPLILHIRDAEKDAIRILKKYQDCIHGGVCHCFCGSAELAKTYTDLGLKIGVGGALLKKSPKQADLEQAVIQTPLASILLETDGPYVKPDCSEIQKKQLRKARNTSLILQAVIARIAELKGIPPEEVEQITAANAERLFGIRTSE